MKKFLRKRWHRMPIGIISVVLALALVAGGVFAIITVWGGKADVVVTECFTVTNLVGDSGNFEGVSPDIMWSISLKPGETKTLKIRVWNSSSVAVPITLSAVESYDDITTLWTPAIGDVPGSGSYDFTLSVTATFSATTGNYTVPISISRG